VTQAEAKALGLKRYFSGKPCKRGHVAERFTNGGCTLCHKINFADWRLKNAAKDRSDSRRWQKENRARVIATIAKREADIDRRTPPWADLKEIDWWYRCARAMSKATGIPHHVDHVIPCRGKFVSGLHVEANLAVIPADQNKRKSNLFEVTA
jgi:hypothetical protein